MTVNPPGSSANFSSTDSADLTSHIYAPSANESTNTDRDTILAEQKSTEEDAEESDEAKGLSDAALSIPDSEAGGTTTSTDDQHAHCSSAGNTGVIASHRPVTDWQSLLSHSSSGAGAATAATSAYFNFAKTATAFGLNVAKRVTQGIVAVPTFLADGALTGTAPRVGDNIPSIAKVAHSGIASFFDAISLVAVGGIDLTSAVTSAGLSAVGSGCEGVRRSLGSEVLRSLAEFSKLVKREWTVEDDSLPPGGIPGYSIIGITKALSTWVSIQLVTRRFQESRMLRGLEEIDQVKLKDDVELLRRSHHVSPPAATAVASTSPKPGEGRITHPSNDVRITSSDSMQGYSGNVIGAEIGNRDDTSNPLPGSTGSDEPARPLTDAEAIHNLQRYSKLVLGVYGGMALYWLKGIPERVQSARTVAQDDSPPTGVVFSAEEEFIRQDQAEFLEAAAQMELEDDEGDTDTGEPSGHAQNEPRPQNAAQPNSYNLWDLISGTHDSDLFHHTARLDQGAAMEGRYIEDSRDFANQTNEMDGKAKPSKPRFYVVTDHLRKTIILVLRGTLSVGDVAADLTCESVPFVFDAEVLDNLSKRQNLPQESSTISGLPKGFIDDCDEYLCHEGIYITAKEIGSRGRSVQRAVATALAGNPGYSIDITGHSLGAGVAAVLAMMWADPTTGLTISSSGLPARRRLHAYCFGVPCVTNEAFGQKLGSIITSYTFSYDLVCRLSLGAIQDIRNGCAWLCYQDKQAGHGPETMNVLMKRAFDYQAGRLDAEETTAVESEFLVLRKTLEANMRNAQLFPPGKVLYSLGSGTDLLPLPTDSESTSGQHRLFKVRHAREALKNVYGQIIFSRNMLSCHMPNVYDDMLHSLAR